MKCQPNLKQRCATFASPTMPLPLEDLTLVSSFHWVFELSLDKLKTMLQAKFGGRGEGGGAQTKCQSIDSKPVPSKTNAAFNRRL